MTRKEMEKMKKVLKRDEKKLIDKYQKKFNKFNFSDFICELAHHLETQNYLQDVDIYEEDIEELKTFFYDENQSEDK